jgi:hypothetical protein
MAIRIKIKIDTNDSEADGRNTHKIIKEVAQQIYATWQAESSYFEDSANIEFRVREKEYVHEIEMTIKSENYGLLKKITALLTGAHALIFRFFNNI